MLTGRCRSIFAARRTRSAQLQEARPQIGCGVVDLSLRTPGSEDPDALMKALELFGKKVLPHIRDI